MYSRETELRHIQSNDVYKLGVILDDNNCWKKLMEIIPKELNAQATSADGALDWEQAVVGGFKYNNDHIRLIENAIKRPGESRLLSQILFDEWGTSGRKCERPTLGVLLQLLVKAELFRAADYVALHLLNEPPPERPLNGPAARIDISLPSDVFNDIEDLVNDTAFYPGTESLNDNANYANSLADNNIDFYTKYQRMDKEVFQMHDNDAPVPPPRTLRSARLLLQQQQQQTFVNETTTAEALNCIVGLNSQVQQVSEESNLPKFSQLMPSNNISTTPSSNINSIDSSHTFSTQHTESTNLSEAPIPMISVLVGSTTAVPTLANNLQMNISALNLNGERDVDEGNLMTDFTSSQNQSSEIYNSNSNACDTYELPNVLENIAEGDDNDDDDDVDDDVDDDDDDDDSSVPNLSIFDQRSSNNDSSLTNVTGTSGENSFELSMNDCSSASNENLPCLSALKP